LYTKNLNLRDPQPSHTYKTVLNQRVANPFYNYLTPAVSRFCNQVEVTLADLLKPFPNTAASFRPTRREFKRYDSFQLGQRPFAKGFNFLLAYNSIANVRGILQRHRRIAGKFQLSRRKDQPTA
jgi:hypothetical protein